MVLVGKAQESARNAPFLQNVEQHESFGDGQPVIQLIMHDEVRGCPLADIVQRIELVVVGPVGPQGAVELCPG